MYKLIDGKALSEEIKSELKVKTKLFEEKFNRKIGLAVVMVGENPASQVYVRNKITTAEKVGIKSLSYHLPEDTSFDELSDLIKCLASDNGIDGILVQLPLPKHLDEQKILRLIPVEKDVDGFCAENLGDLLLGKECIRSCTPYGVIKMLESAQIELVGKNAVIIGRSNIVGKPLALMLLQKNCTVTVCHSKTQDLDKITSKADILIAAIGKPKFVKENMVKDGAVVIDVGINRTEEGLCGDVDFENVKDKASFISKVPGGVGPMTIAMLMNNAYECAIRRKVNE